MIELAVRKYSTLAIPSQDGLVYGLSPHPLDCGLGLTIGGGLVFPEVNFTLPPMNIDEQTWPEVRRQYTEIIEGACRRAVDLEIPALLVEFETLPPMTVRPVIFSAWVASIATRP